MNRISATISCILLLAFCSISYARTYDNKNKRVAPKVLLIEINTQKNRMQYLQQKRDTKKLAELKKATRMAAAAMIHDFTDHFNFCPVYYFYDTDREAILRRDYSVLTDAAGKPLSSNVITETDEIKIAYFGYPDADHQLVKDAEAESPDGEQYAQVHTSGTGKGNVLECGMVVCDKDFKETKTDRRFYVGRNRDLTRLRNDKYSYSSSDFSIDYIRSAKTLNRLLTDYYTLKSL